MVSKIKVFQLGGLLLSGKYDILVVGAGITGLTIAERFGNEGKSVLVVDRRSHLGGNCYDYLTEGIYVHEYGPHIFHSDYKEVWEYLTRFTDWVHYQHKVLALIDGELVPVPFNLNSIKALFPASMSKKLIDKLLEHFGYGREIKILDLLKVEDHDLRWLANYVYEKVFAGYSEKQWGKRPEEIDSSVTARVPVVISTDNRYFHDRYQGVPLRGYTAMFNKMLQCSNIEVLLETDFKDIKSHIDYKTLFYTGEIDAYFDYCFGKLKYRCFNYKLLNLPQPSYQPAAVVNYPNEYDFTRITEFKKFYNQDSAGTIIGIEYPEDSGVTAWPMLDPENLEIYRKYRSEVDKLKDSYFLGRLADFTHYSMDDAVNRALQVYKEVLRFV